MNDTEKLAVEIAKPKFAHALELARQLDRALHAADEAGKELGLPVLGANWAPYKPRLIVRLESCVERLRGVR